MALDALALEGDPFADQVIEELVADGSIDAVNTVLAHLRSNDQPIPRQLPESVRGYLIETDQLPEWVDTEQIARAHPFFVDNGVHVASVLSYGSMVNCYAQPRPARLLSLTHRLNQPKRRLSETSQFVLHMMGREPFGAGGSFVPTVQKTRLIHAAVRYFVAQSAEWDVERDGVPICQQDLLGAMLIFSVGVIQGMRRIGISVSDVEAQDYYYVWWVTGVMLGIRPEVMPERFLDAEQRYDEVVAATFGPSPEGIALTRGLLDAYEELIPGKVFDGVAAAMVRQVVDPAVADWLQVPKSTGWARFVSTGVRLMKIFERAETGSTVASAVLDRAGQLLLAGSVRMLTDGQSTTLNIPTELRIPWTACGRCPHRSELSGQDSP